MFSTRFPDFHPIRAGSCPHAAMPNGTARNRIVELDNPDLPISCPSKDTPLWSMHPRIFLDPTHESVSMCPYCGTIYRIKPGPTAKPH